MKYVLIGRIVNTHGLKGEVRILSDFQYKDRVFKKGMKIYIGHDKVIEEINSYRFHKIFDMITMVGYSDINEVLKYKGEYVFIDRDSLILNKDEYLDEDIVGLKVFVDDKYIGDVCRIDKHSINKVLVVRGNKNYLIPYNYDIIKKINVVEKRMDVNNIVGLFD